jgi:hypothetical protein
MASKNEPIKSRLRTNPKKNLRYVTMDEAIRNIPNFSVRNVTILPPTSGDLAVDSDEEVVPTGENDPPTEVAKRLNLIFLILIPRRLKEMFN